MIKGYEKKIDWSQGKDPRDVRIADLKKQVDNLQRMYDGARATVEDLKRILDEESVPCWEARLQELEDERNDI